MGRCISGCGGVICQRIGWLVSMDVTMENIYGRMRPNSALLTDTFTSPLRAQRGAAKRER
jgi:hypothetical protein